MIRRRSRNISPPRRVAPPTDPELLDVLDEILNGPDENDSPSDDLDLDDTLDPIDIEPEELNSKILRE
jgi:hypothetical protein